MLNHDKNLQMANKMMNSCVVDSEFDRIYPFTTENISGYINLFDLKDKSLLTLGSSGDQAINAYLKGAKDITLLDINPFTKYYYFLKVAAINTISREKFYDFFKYYGHPTTFKSNEKAFNIETYEKLKSELRRLDYESYLFWDDLFYEYEPIEIRRRLFNDDEERTTVESHFNLYLSSDDIYNKMKYILCKDTPTFINEDINSLNLKKKYDNIWLSNVARIYDSIDGIYDMTKSMYDLLDDEGKMLIAYLYNYRENEVYNSDWYVIYDTDKVLERLSEFKPEIKYFLGERGIKAKLANYPKSFYQKDTDAIYLCKKKIKK